MKVLSLVLFALLITTQPLQAAVCVGFGSATPTCAGGTIDYIGRTTTVSETNGSLAQDRLYLKVYTPTAGSGSCSTGNITVGHFRHMTTTTQNLRLCVWLDAGTPNAPDASDTKIGCGIISSSAIETISVTITGAVSMANKYWIGVLTDGGLFDTVYNTSGAGTLYYQSGADFYTNPFNTLPASGYTDIARDYQMYVEVGP